MRYKPFLAGTITLSFSIKNITVILYGRQQTVNIKPLAMTRKQSLRPTGALGKS